MNHAARRRRDRARQAVEVILERGNTTVSLGIHEQIRLDQQELAVGRSDLVVARLRWDRTGWNVDPVQAERLGLGAGPWHHIQLRTPTGEVFLRIHLQRGGRDGST